MIGEKPLFPHDCPTCRFLGRFRFEGQDRDLYYCPGEPTVLARFGKDGDYASGLPFINNNPLREAALRAIEAGHLDPKIETGCAGQGTVEEYLTRTMAADSAAT